MRGHNSVYDTYYAAINATSNKQFSKKKKPWVIAFAYFRGKNAPTIANFKLPIWFLWMQGWENRCSSMTFYSISTIEIVVNNLMNRSGVSKPSIQGQVVNIFNLLYSVSLQESSHKQYVNRWVWLYSSKSPLCTWPWPSDKELGRSEFVIASLVAFNQPSVCQHYSWSPPQLTPLLEVFSSRQVH